MQLQFLFLVAQSTYHVLFKLFRNESQGPDRAFHILGCLLEGQSFSNLGPEGWASLGEGLIRLSVRFGLCLF